jgi:hypothetical protein
MDMAQSFKTIYDRVIIVISDERQLKKGHIYFSIKFGYL